MSDPAHARRLAADGRVRGHCLVADQVGRAAELLVRLRAAGPHDLGLGHLDFTTHLPRAALDRASAPLLRPPGDRARPRGWNHHQQPDS